MKTKTKNKIIMKHVYVSTPRNKNWPQDINIYYHIVPYHASNWLVDVSDDLSTYTLIFFSGLKEENVDF
jgi:hypothetical protein